MIVWTRKLAVLVLAFSALPLPIPALAASPFNCSLARTAAEILVCDSPELDALDRDASHAYDRQRAALLAGGKSDAVEALRAGQFGFLRARDACGFDVACLTALYKARIKALGANALSP